MGAVLTLASPSVGTTGKIVTATIGGGSGGYSITDKTGLTLSLTGGVAQPFGFPIASVAVSGTTLTIILVLPIGVGDTVQFTRSATSNLTDSSANTIFPTFGAITNGSSVAVTTLGPSSTLVEYNGIVGSPSSINNVEDFAVEVVTDHVECGMLGLAAGGAATTFQIDGGTVGTAPTDTQGWLVRQITTSPLAAGMHLYCIAYGSYYYGLRLSGGTTVVTVPTAKITPLNNPGAYANVPAVSPATTTGTYQLNTSGVSGAIVTGSTGGCEIDFAFTGTAVDVLGVWGADFATEIDGAPAGQIVRTSSDGPGNGYGWLNTHPTVAAPGSHTYHMTQVGATTGGAQVQALRIVNTSLSTAASSAGDTTMTVGSTTSLAVGAWVKIDHYLNRERRKIASISGNVVTFTTALTYAHAVGVRVLSYTAPQGTFSRWSKYDRTHGLVALLGDSNTQGANDYGPLFTNTPDSNGTYYESYDPRCPPMYLAATTLGMQVVNIGVQGTTASQAAAQSAALSNYTRGSAKYVTIWTGTNDINGNTPRSNVANYTTDVQTAITAAQAILAPGGKVVLMPPLTPVGVTNAQGLSPATCLTALQGLASSNANTVCVSNLADGLVSGDYNGLHYHVSGQQKMAATLAPYLGGAVGGPVPVLAAAGFFAA